MKLIILLFLLSSNVFSKDLLSSKADTLYLTMGLYGDTAEGNTTKAKIFGSKANFDYQRFINESLSFHFNVSLTFESGYNESLGVAEYEPLNTLDLRSAGLSYRPVDFYQAEIGSIALSKYNSPLLLGANVFAGISQKISFYHFYIQSLYSVPSNNVLTKRTGVVEEGVPLFTMETLGFKYGVKSFLHLAISRFNFSDLPNSTSETSKIIGNSVTGLGKNSKYLYEFNGINFMLDSKIDINLYGPTFGGEYIKNDKAPEDRNEAQLIRVGFFYHHYEIFSEIFESETDASVAFYNSKDFGHNNMKGSSLGFKYSDDEYSFKARIAKLNPIESNVLQSETDLFSFDFKINI